MKRILMVMLVSCLLLCGCRSAAPETTEPAPAPETTDATTEVTTEATTEATQPQAARVTVYLLECAYMTDSGRMEYHYDEHYNIDYYEVFDMENNLLFTTRFDEKDENGMAGYVWSDWGDGSGEGMYWTYFADGKPKEALYEVSNFSGYQYEYDLKGDITEQREYWEGILQSVVYYEYEGEQLSRVYCEDAQGARLYDCHVENGRIAEKHCYAQEGDYSYSYTYIYTYDENGNLALVEFLYEGERSPSDAYTYKAVEVDADRAGYLINQQKYQLSII